MSIVLFYNFGKLNYMENKKINVKNLIAYIIPVIIVIAHIIVIVSAYPGICYYDIEVQLEQYNSGIFNTSHPLLHTLFIGYFSNLFDGNKGFAIATYVQMLMVDSCIYYMLMYVYSKTKSIISHIIFVCFFAFMPICSFLVISHTKDILFAAFAIVFVIDLLRFDSSKETYSKARFRVYCIRMVINIILMLLLRNNAVYAYAVMVLLLFFTFIKSKKKAPNKELLIVLSLALLFTFCASKSLTYATHANPGSIKEMMSIPSQIMARVYNTTATDEEKEVILKYIARPEDYTYYLSDHIKMQLEFDTVDSTCKHFLLDSAIIALHHPLQSLTAVWFNIQGFFDPIHCPYSSEHFFLVPLAYRGGAVFSPKWMTLFDFYHEWFFISEKLSHTPFIIFFNMATYIWFYIISLVLLIRKKRREPMISYLFPLLYLGTLLLGPGAIIRYGFMYILLIPVAWMNVTSSKDTRNK